MRRLLATLGLALFSLPLGADAAEKRPISAGDFFPPYRISAQMAAADQDYLGVADRIRQSGEFAVSDVWGDLLVFEIFNRFCFGCQQSAPLVNRAYELVASDPELSRRVRFLGVGVGNNAKAVEAFREEFSVPFPLVPDPRFGILDALGNPGGTPFTIMVRRTPKGRMVVSSHFGQVASAEDLVAEVRKVLAGEVDALVAKAGPTEVAEWVVKELKVPLTDEQVLDRVGASMERAGYGKVGLYTVALDNGEKVYVGESRLGKVFSRVVSRPPVCDVCHPVHFILTVNSKGQVVDFDAISVTKYWNVEWSPEETASMRKRLLGLSIFEDRVFDPSVDAVSTATMSSSLIFDSLLRTGPVMDALKKAGKI